MIVCVCNNISESRIRTAVSQGLGSMPALRESLGVGACCGKCHSFAKTILRDCLENEPLESQTCLAQAPVRAEAA